MSYVPVWNNRTGKKQAILMRITMEVICGDFGLLVRKAELLWVRLIGLYGGVG